VRGDAKSDKVYHVGIVFSVACLECKRYRLGDLGNIKIYGFAVSLNYLIHTCLPFIF